MFGNLSEKFSGIFSKIRAQPQISAKDIDNTMREIRVALLEADVSLEVVKNLIEKLSADAGGRQVIKGVSAADMIIKSTNDAILEILGGKAVTLSTKKPKVIMMIGLQGSGKTTTTAKLALNLSAKQDQKSLMVSLDTYRPAAQEQLKILGEQIDIQTLPIVAEQAPIQITKRAIKELGAFDNIILDTAGRLHIDENMLVELKEIDKIARPDEILLVIDAMTGQDAVRVAAEFKRYLGITGVIMTRMDSDARGGAALSIRAATGCPIKFLGSGEKLNDLEIFHPERIASRILGMGDIVSLVEKASELASKQEMERVSRRMMRGELNLDDLATQLRMLNKFGGFGKVLGFLPGMANLKQAMSALGAESLDGKAIKRQGAILSSMTKRERKFPRLLNPSRKSRIAKGSGVSIQEVNGLLKNFEKMRTMMKKVSKMQKSQKIDLNNLLK
ncbi:signal recognition particle protein [Rickettsiales bacterium]|nr:signal recognition particle protein [Rickettsiales bacterium]